MSDLASHLEHDHGDGEGVGHGPGEGRRPHRGVSPGADHGEVRAVADTWDINILYIKENKKEGENVFGTERI